MRIDAGTRRLSEQRARSDFVVVVAVALECGLEAFQFFKQRTPEIHDQPGAVLLPINREIAYVRVESFSVPRWRRHVEQVCDVVLPRRLNKRIGPSVVLRDYVVFQ